MHDMHMAPTELGQEGIIYGMNMLNTQHKNGRI